MKARDVMVTHVITVGPDQDVGAVARILLKNGISAVPVVDGVKLLGIVSEGDLIRRAESGTERSPSWLMRLLTSPQQLAEDFVRSHARNVKDVMTRDVVTAGPETSLRDIANLLEKHRIKRVPIVSNGQVVGIVSRANIVQALASRGTGIAGVEPNDEKLRDAVVASLRKQPGDTSLVNVIAEGGVVTLWGFAASQEERKAIRVAAEVTPGVRAVNDNIHIRSFVAGI